MRWTGTAAAIFVAAAPLVVASEARYRDGPPPGFTGDFGEPTCVTCHMDATAVADAPGLVLDGVPDIFEPGRTYLITVELHDEELEAGGFQLSARTSSGKQAGSWQAKDSRSRVVYGSMSNVAYAIHTVEGAEPVAPDSARWTLAWTAPDSSGDSVVFSAAANAANGDDSSFGDRIFTRRAVSRRR